MEGRPKELRFIDEAVMSNFDHEINIEIANKLREGGYYADYSAWNFHGEVWYDDGKWKCEIRRYHRHIKTIVADTLKEIMEQASHEYGYD
jgi:hypothetical protein